jgi:hypothetical protein
MSDTIATDGDKSFVGVNQRLQINELQPGEVRESLNGRMEGYWKPRKSVASKTGALTTASKPLKLPFYLIDTAKTISGVSVPSTGVIRITVTSHGFEVDSSGWAKISDLDAAINGSYELTYVDANTLEYLVPGVTSVTDTNGLLSQMPIDDFASANVRASCLFSDPNQSNKEFVIVALDTVAKKIDLDGYAITDIPYPIGQSLGEDTDMIQVFDKVMLFRDGKQAFEWYPNGRPIVSASSNADASPDTVVTINVRDHGLLVGASIVISGLTAGTPPNGTYVVATVVDQDTFTFVAASISPITPFTVTNAIATDGFTLSPGGIYTQPQTFNIEAKDVEVANGLVEATVPGTVTIKAGDIIVVRQAETVDLASMVGAEFQVVSATTTVIKWYAPVGNYSTSSTDIFEFGGRFSVGGGFMHQPGAPWGIHFQRRLWVPYYYDGAGTFDLPTYTTRKITDEIAVSDILDTTTFDRIANQFRVSGGTADYVVAMHGFYEDQLVVLNRNSLHLISGTIGSLSDTKVTELTSEVGCLARKSVVMKGNVMLFLSDDGVYGVEFLNDYNLRGVDEPLSKNIQPYIDRLNKNFADKSVAVLHENRYYLAIPLDSSPGANDSYGNNAILVFNFLNKGWESLDTFGDSRFLIEDFVIGSAGVRNNIYAVTSNGGLHQLEAFESSNDTLNVDNSDSVVSPSVTASLTTRGYDFETLERKRFTDAQVNMQTIAGQSGEYDISFAAEDPDAAQLIGTTTSFLGELLTPSTANEAETASIRCRLGGIRGSTGTMILTRNIGSPKINSVTVSGSITNRQIISQR